MPRKPKDPNEEPGKELKPKKARKAPKRPFGQPLALEAIPAEPTVPPVPADPDPALLSLQGREGVVGGVPEDPWGRLEEFKDFRNLLYHVWLNVGLPAPTELQYDIATWLQHGPKRRMIKGFRGVAKSWSTAAYAIYRLYWNPDLKIVLVSGAKRYADDLSTFMLQIIRTIPEFNFLDCAGRTRHSKLQFDVGPANPHKQASVTSLGITGQLTSSRADLIVSDDIETLSNALTEGGRETLRIRMREFEAILSPGGEIVFLGTPQTEESIYKDLVQKGYSIREWPAEYPTPEGAALRPFLAPLIAERAKADPNLAGHSTEPTRFTDIDLEERKLSYGLSDYARQFLLDTSLDDSLRFPLKLKDLLVYPCSLDAVPDAMHWTGMQDQRTEHPNVGQRGDGLYAPRVPGDSPMSPFTGVAMFIDPAGTGTDETAVAVGKHAHGRIFVPEWTGFAGGYSDTVLASIAELAKLHKVNAIVVEANFGDGMFTKLLQSHVQRVHPCSIEEVKVHRQKELRIIDTLEPVMNQHRLCLDPRVVQRDAQLRRDVGEEMAVRYSGLYQLTRITRERGCLAKDDRVDALAGLVAYWLEVFARDTNKSAAAHQEALFFKRTLKDVVQLYDLGKPDRGSSSGVAANAGVRSGRPNTGLSGRLASSRGGFRWAGRVLLPGETRPADSTGRRGR